MMLVVTQGGKLGVWKCHMPSLIAGYNPQPLEESAEEKKCLRLLSQRSPCENVVEFEDGSVAESIRRAHKANKF